MKYFKPLIRCFAFTTFLVAALSWMPDRATCAAEQGLSPAGRYPGWNAAFAGPVFQRFGIDENGKSKASQSWFQVKPEGNTWLSFDLTNNGLRASLDPNGTIRNAKALEKIERKNALPGMHALLHLLNAGPWGITVKAAGFPAVSATGKTSVDLLDGLIPVFRRAEGPIRAEWLIFAPEAPGELRSPLRALILVVRLTNSATNSTEAVIKTGDLPEINDPALPADSYQAIVGLDGLQWTQPGRTVAVMLPPGGSAVRSFAFILGNNSDEIKATARRLTEVNPLVWLNRTLWRVGRLGRLTIPEAPYLPEMLVRYAELCRSDMLYKPDGYLATADMITFNDGPAKGPHITTRWSWPSLVFYNMLPMCMSQPNLCLDAIPFYLEYGQPAGAYGRGKSRFKNAPPITHSIQNAMGPFILAGTYYQMTGDAAGLKMHPELLAAAKTRFEQLIGSRTHANVWLFPSMYISDGDARGDYHTGSNVLAWKALLAMARLAREVYGDEASATAWSDLAGKVKSDILSHCVGDSPDGRRFFEGANEDGTFIPGHDGEESDVGLMPFYEFTEADDSLLLTHSRLALSERNPLYVKEADGIAWVDYGLTPLGNNPGVTFPGWTTALAGAHDEAELAVALDKIVNRTDVDGSPWWWPQTKLGGVQRVGRRGGGAGKCGWAAGVYLCRFIHDIIGVQVDVPARQVALRPFCPWNSFEWKDGPFGNAGFDVRYEKADGRLTAMVVNRNAEPYRGVIELTLPPGARAMECRVDGRKTIECLATTRYGRPAVRVAHPIPSGQALRLEVDYDLNSGKTGK